MKSMTRRLQWSLFLRSLALQGSWNHQRMQNLGLLWTVLTWLRLNRGDVNRDRVFCRRYYGYFNTNPYLANFLFGGLIRLEEDQGIESDADHSQRPAPDDLTHRQIDGDQGDDHGDDFERDHVRLGRGLEIEL